MLADNAATATVATKDLKRAKAFYKDKLGLPLLDERKGVATFKAGADKLFVYESSFAGTNQATSVTWSLDRPADVDAAVKELKSKGVAFEHYDSIPDLKADGDVYRGANMSVAWFKDPDGNILSLVGGD